MKRLTDKKVLANFKAIKNISPDYVASNEELIYAKLGKLEDLMEKYHIRDVEHLEKTLEAFEFSKLGKIFPSYLQEIEKESE